MPKNTMSIRSVISPFSARRSPRTPPSSSTASTGHPTRLNWSPSPTPKFCYDRPTVICRGCRLPWDPLHCLIACWLSATLAPTLAVPSSSWTNVLLSIHLSVFTMRNSTKILKGNLNILRDVLSVWPCGPKQSFTGWNDHRLLILFVFTTQKAALTTSS